MRNLKRMRSPGVWLDECIWEERMECRKRRKRDSYSSERENASRKAPHYHSTHCGYGNYFAVFTKQSACWWGFIGTVSWIIHQTTDMWGCQSEVLAFQHYYRTILAGYYNFKITEYLLQNSTTWQYLLCYSDNCLWGLSFIKNLNLAVLLYMSRINVIGYFKMHHLICWVTISTSAPCKITTNTGM